MLNNCNTKCPFEDEILSYIYDEMIVQERTKFETHLSDCSVCTDEFAAISEARFSVFEWQKEDFRHLPTPAIVIPYAPKRQVAEEAASVGFLAGLRGWLQPLPIAAAAGLLVVLGLSFSMLRSVGPTDQSIASNSDARFVEVPSGVPVRNVETVSPSGVKQPEIAATTLKTTSKETQPVKTVVHRQPVNVKQTFAKNIVTQRPSARSTKAPVLSSYEAEDDNSLRLADLLADIDS